MDHKINAKLINLRSAVDVLRRFLKTSQPDEIQRAGIIQAFEFSFELFWKFFSVKAEAEGLVAGSPKSAFAAAFRLQWIKDDGVWLAMLKHRNESVHTYQNAKAEEIYLAVRDHYAPSMESVLLELEAER